MFKIEAAKSVASEKGGDETASLENNGTIICLRMARLTSVTTKEI